jgi:hypothetical protein
LDKFNASEAAQIVDATLRKLLLLISSQGRPAVDVRRAVGNVLAHVQTMLRTDTIGPPLVEVFEQAKLAGITLPQLHEVQLVPAGKSPVTLGGTLIKNSLIELVLAAEGDVVSNSTYNSRDEVDRQKQTFNSVFAEVEESVADSMDSLSYRAIVGLHAAITNYLTEVGRPLARMVDYRFAATYSTLKIAHRLYTDASRADGVRAENKIVHPAFCPVKGKALSS